MIFFRISTTGRRNERKERKRGEEGRRKGKEKDGEEGKRTSSYPVMTFRNHSSEN
jgi:hypothetical protein